MLMSAPGPDFMLGQVAVELMKMLMQVSTNSTICRSRAEELKETIEVLFPIIHEVKYSGVELPASRQFQLDRVSDDLRNGLELCHKIIRSSRWNAYKNLQYAKKLEKVNKMITMFIRGSMQMHMMADLHRLNFQMTERFDQLQGSADSVEGILGKSTA